MLSLTGFWDFQVYGIVHTNLHFVPKKCMLRVFHAREGLHNICAT